MMENINCKKCKYFDGQCQNFNLTRAAKARRLNGIECEYWQEKDQSEAVQKSTRQMLLDMAIQLEKIAYSLNDEQK